ncbi:unnamed protein product [Rotaria sp. Silwood2]|nr:unnamed protein product [Rotaria sp. Silwood2]
MDNDKQTLTFNQPLEDETIKLRRFRNYFNEVPEYSLDSTPSNPLNTPFWIKRQDILDIQIYTSNIKKRWYDDTQNKTVNSSVELSKSTRLTLVFINPDAPQPLASIYTSHLSIIVQIFHLEIQIDDFLLQTLIEIMKYLPEHTTLKICSLSSDRSINLCFTDPLLMDPDEYRNRITKIYLETMHDIEEFHLLLELGPSMTYFKVDYTCHMTIEHVLRCIIMKINHDHLRLLCFRIQTTDNYDDMIEKLEKMINVENLLLDYKMTRVCDNVYVEWK